MTYLVHSTRTRREFESLREASDFMRADSNSRIYEIDGFGNPIKISPEELIKRLSLEDKAHAPETESKIVIKNPEMLVPDEKKPEESPMRMYFKYGLLFIMALIVLAIVIFMIIPMINEFSNTFNRI
ncbi:MAG: hypothetical protein NTV63_05330 [Candidatus Woesearchaeota archaeon]|nr:hypothetical protein [Candidatus Woesearchaeota archaeon]